MTTSSEVMWLGTGLSSPAQFSPVQGPVWVPGDLCCPGLSGLGLGQPVSQSFGKRYPLPLQPLSREIDSTCDDEPPSQPASQRSASQAPGQWPTTRCRPKRAQSGHGWTCPPQLRTANSESHQPSFAHRSPGGLDPYHTLDAATSFDCDYTNWFTSFCSTGIFTTHFSQSTPTLFVVKCSLTRRR